MSAHLLQPPVRYWACPSCGTRDRTQNAPVEGIGYVQQFHPCPAFSNASIPLIEVPTPDAKPDGRQVAVLREDDGTVASIRTEHGDGSNACTVFAPTATLTSEARI